MGTLLEAFFAKVGINPIVLGSRRLRETIQGLSQPVHLILHASLLIPLRFLHICSFFQISMQEGRFDIQLVHFPSSKLDFFSFCKCEISSLNHQHVLFLSALDPIWSRNRSCLSWCCNSDYCCGFF